MFFECLLISDITYFRCTEAVFTKETLFTVFTKNKSKEYEKDFPIRVACQRSIRLCFSRKVCINRRSLVLDGCRNANSQTLYGNPSVACTGGYDL